MTKDTTEFVTEPYSIKVEKPWGYELVLTNNLSTKITSKILHINSGKRISLQYHDVKEEVITLISGKSLLYIENNTGEVVKIDMELNKGYLILPYQTHRLEAVLDSIYFESSTPESGNTIRLQDDYSRGIETELERSKMRSNL
jgi:oxalate decarboxylase/phosphoglucose isomerase-like protein (cupin superfamily)